MALLLAGLGALPLTGSALADDTTVTVSGGLLGVTAPAVNDFAVITLSGSAQAAEAPLEPFAVTDARGTGQGWTLVVQASTFREWDGSAYVAGGKALPLGSLSLVGLSVAGDGTDSPAPEVVVGPYVLDNNAVPVAVAATGTGMGRFTVTPTGGLRVAVPASAYARTYRSEVSLSVTSGP